MMNTWLNSGKWGKINNNPPPSFKKIKIKPKSDRMIEMSSMQSEFSKELKKKIKKPLLVIIIFIAVFVFLLPDSQPSREKNTIQLIAPRFNQPKKPQEEIIKRIKDGLTFYFHDQTSLYLKAQNEWIQAIEGDPKNKLALSYICLAYLELWPFSNKSLKDKKTISSVASHIGAIDQGGIYSALCQSIGYLIKEQYDQAESLVKTSIEEAGKNKNPDNVLPFFYYLKSLVQKNQLKYEMTLKSLEYVQTLLPQWVRPYSLSAEILKQRKELSPALKNYLKILKINPQHKGALLNKAVLEYQYLGKQKLAQTNIQKALNQPDLVLSSDLASAYFVLTQIALKNNDPKQALEYGKKSYSLNPSNKQLENMISQIGGDEQVKKTKVKSQQLIERGDQFTREGRLVTAQGYYKTAFEVDQGKNSLAAKKMGQNLWKLGLAVEAIEWLKKSITADPEHLESYILLSDYYSQVYDFDNASRILNTARKKSPNSVDIFKGYALLQFRRENFEGVIMFSQKAIELYESDVDSYVLMSQTYRKTGEFDLSLKMASQAVEINSNSRPAQIQYGYALGHTHGPDTAFSHFEKLISHSQKHSQNHIEYTLALGQFLLDQKIYGQAQAVLENLNDLENKPLKYHLLLGQTASMQDDISKAYEQFVDASSINPSAPLPLLYLGQLLSRTKQYSEARDYFKKILASYPRYPQIHYYIAKTFMLEGGKENLESALEEAQIETQINPNESLSFQLLGDIYDKLGKHTLCAQAFQKAIEIFPENSELYVRVAVCYRKSGELDLALRVLKSISEATKNKGRSSNPKVFREMGALYELKKDYHNATNSYSIYLTLLPGADDRKQIEQRIKNFGQ